MIFVPLDNTKKSLIPKSIPTDWFVLAEGVYSFLTSHIKGEIFQSGLDTHTKIVNKFIPETFKGKPEEYRYLIITYRLNNGNIEKFWVNFWEIERKMTTEEIKDYEIHITTKKYNL